MRSEIPTSAPQSLHLLLAISSLILSVCLIGYAWQYREEPAGRSFLALLFSLGVFSLLAIANHISPIQLLHPAGRVITIWRELRDVAALSLFGVLWGIFALRYTGREHLVTRPQSVILLSIPSYHVLVIIIMFRRLLSDSVITVLYTISYIINYLVVAIVISGAVLIIESSWKYNQVSSDQAMMLALGGIAPFSGSILSFMANSYASFLMIFPLFDYLLSSVLVTNLLFGIALTRYSIFEMVPAAGQLGPEQAITEMEDGMVILDRNARILQLNSAAQRIFDCSSSGMIGEPVDALLDKQAISINPELDLSETTIQEGRRRFKVTVSLLDSRDNTHVGYVLLIYDITEQKLREQRLEVLNRVLRHNLRNSMNVVNIHAQRISESSADLPVVSEKIQSISTDLVRLGNKARTIEQILAEEPIVSNPTNLTTVIENMVADIEEEYPRSEVRAIAPDELLTGFNGRILEPILWNVIENAVEHNDQPIPEVEVTVSKEDAADAPLVISVADNGPGIPEHECAALRNETERPLEHGSGLGLWLVKWGMDRLGGDVVFAENEPRGSILILQLPGQGESTL